MNTLDFVVQDVEVSAGKVLAALGCGADQQVSGRLRRQIQKAIAGVTERIEYQSAYRSYPIRVRRGRVFVDARDIALKSTRLSQAMQPCQRLFAYVVTLGPQVDAYIDEWMEKRPDFGVVVDAVASVTTDTIVAQVEQEIAEHLPPSQALTLPFSAGYCDWSVAEQAKIFELLPTGAAGVTLSPDAMMTPRKSISGVFGAGPVSAVTQAGCPCTSCPRTDCQHRRRPYSGRSHEQHANLRPARSHRDRAAKFSVSAAPR